MPRLLPTTRTFRDAFHGIGAMFRTELNARVHLASAIVVVAGGLALDLPRIEWLILVLTIAAVLSLEAVNTAIEAICDVVSPDEHREIGRAKDVAAGAVLIAAIASVVVAILIFGPRLWALAGSH